MLIEELKVKSVHFMVQEWENSVHETENEAHKKNPLRLYDSLIPKMKEQKTIAVTLWDQNRKANALELKAARELEEKLVSLIQIDINLTDFSGFDINQQLYFDM